MTGPREITPASPALLRLLVRQNEEALAGLRQAPPSDQAGAQGRQRRLTIEELADQRQAMARLSSESFFSRKCHDYHIEPGKGHAALSPEGARQDARSMFLLRRQRPLCR